MTFLEAAYKILKEKKKPLHYEEITRIAIERGLIETEGKSPELSMHSSLSRDIKIKGPSSLFRKTEKRGFFEIKTIEKDLIDIQLKLFKAEEKIDKVENSNLFFGKAGEYIVAGELLFRGFNSTILPVDIGLDIVAEKEGRIFNIQVKTSKENRYNRYNFNLRVSSFNRHDSRSTFYVFVIRERKNQKFIILPQKKIIDLIKKKLIKKIVRGKYYLVSIKKEINQGYYLKHYDLSYYIDNWELIN